MRTHTSSACVFLVLSLLARSAGAQIYATNFDDDVGWTMSSTPSCQDQTWAVDATPGGMTGGPYLSPPSSLNFNDGFCYCWCWDGTATSPPIDISAASNPQLRFWCNWDAEEGCSFDQMWLRIGNGGATNNLMEECISTLCPGQHVWHEHVFALDAAWGIIQVQFWFHAIDDLFNGSGWFIDDLVVEGDCPDPQNYCLTAPNSVDPTGAVMGFNGSTNISNNNLRLKASPCPVSQPCIFYFGPNQVQIPFGNGWRCVGGTTFRFPHTSTGVNGVPSILVDYDVPPGNQIQAGSHWNFQCWYRDPPAGGANFNLSDGLSADFCP